MKKCGWLAAVFCCVLSLWAGPKGTVPRASVNNYPLHAQGDGFSIGASVLTREQARKTFVSNVNRCFLVVEIAVYPEAKQSRDVSLNDFALREDEKTALKPSTPKVVAASLQKNAEGDRDIAVYPTTGIGYGSGRGGGVYTQTGVGVAIGSPGGPGVSDKDRGVMETELIEKGLPEGATSRAVSGYVYFSFSSKKKGDYQLEYTANNRKISLPIHIQ